MKGALASFLSGAVFAGRGVRMTALCVTVAAGFFAARNTGFYVWNDTPAINAGGYAGSSNQAVHRRHLLTHPDIAVASLVRCAFADAGENGYRPLASLQSILLMHLVDLRQPSLWHLALWGAVYGAFGVALWRVSTRFLGDETWALLPVLLTLASPSVVGASWVLVAGFQILVPLSICLALLLYWKATEAIAGHGWSLVLLLLAGPWYREILITVPLLLGWLELHRARRMTGLHLLFVLAFLHALFPTALPKLLFGFQDLPLKPVTRLGLVDHQMQAAIRWVAAWHFVPLFPPLLLSLGLIAALRGSWIRVNQLAAWKKEGRVRSGADLLGPVWVLASFGTWASGSELFGTVLLLGLAVLGMRYHIGLAVWFCLTFLPVLRVFAEHVHFLYAIVPASIILTAASRELWQACCGAGLGVRFCRLAVVATLAVALLDQLVAVPSSRAVVQAQHRGMEQVARALVSRLPAGSVVVTNAVHGDEIRWQANGHFDVRPTVSLGTWRPERSVENRYAMLRLMHERVGAVYLLDCDYDFLPEKSYHRHRYVHANRIETEAAGRISETCARYVFLDPLRHLVPRRFVPFLGPPDLENDFYTGPARDGRWFTYENRVSYRLLRVIGNRLEPLPDASRGVRLVARHETGMNILQNGDGYFAIPQSDGLFDFRKFRERRYSRQFADYTLAELEEQIEDSGVDALPMPGLGTTLVADIDGLNVLRHGEAYFAIPQSEGAFDVHRFRRREYSRQFAGYSLQGLRTRIRAARPTPTLICEDVCGMNVIAEHGVYYAIPRGAGAFDREKFLRNGYASQHSAPSLANLKLQLRMGSAGASTRPNASHPLLADRRL